MVSGPKNLESLVLCRHQPHRAEERGVRNPPASCGNSQHAEQYLKTLKEEGRKPDELG